MKLLKSVIEELKECIDILESTNRDVKQFYEIETIDHKGSRKDMEPREKYLELLIDVVIQNLSLLQEKLEDQNDVRKKVKLIK